MMLLTVVQLLPVENLFLSFIGLLLVAHLLHPTPIFILRVSSIVSGF